MREILFRGKNVDNGEWIYGDYAAPFAFYPANIFKQDGNFEGIAVVPETVGQFTGKTDMNGRMIFEGDIVKNNWCFIHSPSVIKFGEYAQPFHDDIHTKHIGFYVEHTCENKDLYRKDLGYYADKCEVIGNIHDNPELIGGEENA